MLKFIRRFIYQATNTYLNLKTFLPIIIRFNDTTPYDSILILSKAFGRLSNGMENSDIDFEVECQNQQLIAMQETVVLLQKISEQTENEEDVSRCINNINNYLHTWVD